MRHFVFSGKALFCLLGVIAFISCKEEVIQVEEDVKFSDDDYIEPAVEQFKEPADLKISYNKARNFNKASEALVIMGQEWAEQMEHVDDEEKLKMAASYEEAQENLIRKFGICGKEEFKWIQTKALPERFNKDIFAKAGVWINR